jgi:hypothetical protein
MDKRYLFISGCPRSGTTALTTIVNWADDAFVGQERYGDLLQREPESFLPGLFRGDRFGSIAQGDCGYSRFEDSGEWGLYHSAAKEVAQYEKHRIVGDKITELYKNFEVFTAPEWMQGDVTVLHIIRNPRAVCASYERRRTDPADTWQHGVDRAISDWTASITEAHRHKWIFRKSRFRLHIVTYEALFERGADEMVHGVRKIFELMGLPFRDVQAEGMTRVHQNSTERAKERTAADPDVDRLLGERVDASIWAKYSYLQDIALFV